jgi:cation transport regulator ChaB
MHDINPKIIEKIHSLIGENAPNSLIEFFNEILKQEARQETQQKESKAVSTAYNTILDKYSQDKKILNFIGVDKD